MSNPKVFLGIDPGLADTGWGIITGQENFKIIKYGIIKTKSGKLIAHRLDYIYTEVSAIIKEFTPQVAAVEKLFFGKNAKTAMIVGQARGVILLACQHQNVEIQEYTPLQVKIALCGYGRAPKIQVQRMVKNLLKLEKIPQPDDAADALAIAYTAAISSRLNNRDL
jgi:crossover junction endodeoxyribonuclease RuvC